MLAEIFMLRLEVMARTSKESITRSSLSSCPSPCQRHLRRRRPIQVFARPEPRRAPSETLIVPDGAACAAGSVARCRGQLPAALLALCRSGALQRPHQTCFRKGRLSLWPRPTWLRNRATFCQKT
jgi:hypothetical protein